MSNHVTPETAKKLKDAGFPMPPPIDPITLPSGQVLAFYNYPTATDILKELGENYCLHINEQWVCECFSDSEMYIQDNPAESCALAWLAIHETKV